MKFIRKLFTFVSKFFRLLRVVAECRKKTELDSSVETKENHSHNNKY